MNTRNSSHFYYPVYLKKKKIQKTLNVHKPSHLKIPQVYKVHLPGTMSFWEGFFRMDKR